MDPRVSAVTGLLQGRRSLVVAVCVVTLAGAFYAVTVPRGFDFDSDHAQYAGLATSLAHGAGYTFNGRFNVKYPPGYPALLAPVSKVSGGSYGAMAVVTAIVGAIVLGLVVLYVRERDRALGLPIAFALALSAAYYRVLSDAVASDMVYLATTAAFLLWAERRWATDGRRSAAFVTGGALLLAYAVLVRTVGIALIVGFALTLIQRAVSRRERPWVGDIAVVATGAAALLGWMVIQSMNRHPLYPGQYYDSYVRQLLVADPHNVNSGLLTPMGAIARAMRAMPLRLAGIAELLTNLAWVKPRWFSPAVAGALVLIAIGVYRDLRRSVPLAAWYFLCYMGIIVLWPFGEMRFLVDVEFLFFLFALGGLRAIHAEVVARPDRARRGVLAVAAVAGALGGATWLWNRSGWSLQDTAGLVAWGALLLLGVWMKRGTWTRRAGAAVRATGVAYVAGYVLLGASQIVPFARRNVVGALPPWMKVRANAAEWLIRNSPPGARAMTTWDASLHYATGRPTVPLPLSTSESVMRAALVGLAPNYIVVFDSTTEGGQYFRPGDEERFAILRAVAPGRFAIAGTFSGGRVYAVRRSETGVR